MRSASSSRIGINTTPNVIPDTIQPQSVPEAPIESPEETLVDNYIAEVNFQSLSTILAIEIAILTNLYYILAFQDIKSLPVQCILTIVAIRFDFFYEISIKSPSSFNKGATLILGILSSLIYCWYILMINYGSNIPSILYVYGVVALIQFLFFLITFVLKIKFDIHSLVSYIF